MSRIRRHLYLWIPTKSLIYYQLQGGGTVWSLKQVQIAVLCFERTSSDPSLRVFYFVQASGKWLPLWRIFGGTFVVFQKKTRRLSLRGLFSSFVVRCRFIYRAAKWTVALAMPQILTISQVSCQCTSFLSFGVTSCSSAETLVVLDIYTSWTASNVSIDKLRYW